MRLQELFEGHLSYVDRGHWAAPHHEQEYVGYAEASGEIVGERLCGRVRCLNHPIQLSRSPDLYHPDYHGVISTQDGATVLWRFQGYNLFEPDIGPEYLGRALMVSTFATDHDRYRWLNQVFAVIEAICTGPVDLADPATEQWHLRAFECVHDLPEVRSAS
jgi:hypothetical protein